MRGQRRHWGNLATCSLSSACRRETFGMAESRV
jgi:hypothetical protein